MAIPRFHIRTWMLISAVVAAICTWPDLFIFSGSVALGASLSLGAIFSTRGRRFLECSVLFGIGAYAALLLLAFFNPVLAGWVPNIFRTIVLK